MRVIPLGTVSTVRAVQRSECGATMVIATGVARDGSATYTARTRTRARQASQRSRRPPTSATGVPDGNARALAMAALRSAVVTIALPVGTSRRHR